VLLNGQHEGELIFYTCNSQVSENHWIMLKRLSICSSSMWHVCFYIHFSFRKIFY